MQFLKTLDGYINMSSIISLEIVAQGACGQKVGRKECTNQCIIMNRE